VTVSFFKMWLVFQSEVSSVQYFLNARVGAS